MKKVYALLTMIMGLILSGIAQPTPPAKLDPTVVPQFVDPMPHFAPGLRVNAKAGGNLLIKAVPAQQVALSTGTVLPNGNTIGVDPGAGLGDYLTYQIFQNGAPVSLPLWPSFTIEAMRDKELKVQYENDLFGLTYPDFNVWTPDPDQTKMRNFNLLADQTLMENGYPLNGDPFLNSYQGPIPMVTHLHGGEIPSNSDGGPMAWFMPGNTLLGPAFKHDASTLCTYPNQQESPTVWYHPHDQGLTRINVYLGMAGYYFIRQPGEDALQLPGWSGDGKVLEIQPGPTSDGYDRTPPFPDVLKSLGLGTQTYLPEVELAIQDRQFNENGGLYWPAGVADGAPNPSIHPYWIPEFTGDIMTVNGKSWPYLSVAPRKYMFRMLDGCNSRFLNLWLSTNDATTGAVTGLKDGPTITVLSTEGGFLEAPVPLDPAAGQTLFLGPAERPMVIIDFTGMDGKTFTLMNDAETVDGPVVPGLDDRIMQFVVNGEMVSPDVSKVPPNLRPTAPMVKLTDFNGGITAGVNIAVKRQLLLNEIIDAGGPAMVAVNNSHVDEVGTLKGAAVNFGAPTEFAREGTTELWQIINTTADAHPMHPHLVTWQIVSRQAFDAQGYMNNAWIPAWPNSVPDFPATNYGSYIDTYPGGAGPPMDPFTQNSAGFLGGNPDVTPFLLGSPVPPSDEEKGWKDAVKSFPGEVLTVLVRVAPTGLPIDTPVDQLVYPFDPSTGPGYVWHCHIIDHEDMDMMRPFMVKYAPIRNVPVVTCTESTSKVVDLNKTTYTVLGTEFTATATAPKGGVLTLNYAITGATNATGIAVTGNPVNGITTVTAKVPKGVLLNAGVNIITWTAVNDEGRTGTCVTTVTVNKRQTAIEYKGVKSVRVNESALLIATLKDKTTNRLLYNKEIIFTIGSQSVKVKTNILGIATNLLKITQSAGHYNVEAKFVGDAYFGESSVSIPFDILPLPCAIQIPNAFSPNGDGINDLFKITCLDQYPNATLSIYQSSKLVYKKNHYGNLDYWGTEVTAWWDGKANQRSNANLPTGTYIYILNLGDGKLSSIKTGFVFLNRK